MYNPTPPTKPTPPTAPVSPRADSSTGNTQTSTSSPAANSQSKAETPAMVKEFESLGKAFQTPAAKTPAAEKSTAATPSADSNKVSPMIPFSTYEETSSQTTVPTVKSPSNNKSAPIDFGFFFYPIVAIAVVAISFWWLKSSKSKPKLKSQPQPQQRAVIDYSKENTKELLDLISSPASSEAALQTTQKVEQKTKVKSNFEIRV